MHRRLTLLALLPVLLLVYLLAMTRYCWAIATNPARAWRIAIGHDQLAIIADQALNCVIKLSDGWGQPDLISTRQGQAGAEQARLRVIA